MNKMNVYKYYTCISRSLINTILNTKNILENTINVILF